MYNPHPLDCIPNRYVWEPFPMETCRRLFTFARLFLYTQQVLQENEGVDMPGLELEKGDKSVGKVQERVLAVTSSHVRTNFNIQSVLVLTTYRCVCVSVLCVCVVCVCVCVCVCVWREKEKESCRKRAYRIVHSWRY